MTNHRQLQPSRWLQNWRGKWSANLAWTGTATVKSREREKRVDGLQPIPQHPVIRLSAMPVGLKYEVTPRRVLSPGSNGDNSCCFQLLRLIATEGVADGAQSGQPLMRLKAIVPWGSA